MGRNQGLPELNDAFQRYYKYTGKLKKLFHESINKLLDIIERVRDKLLPNELLINERIIEYPLTFRYLKSNAKKVLDVGCCTSRLPIQLASMGYKVWGIDIRPYNFQHRNFIFQRSNVLNLPFENDFFDVITAISTIEHIGLGSYGDANIIPNGDRRAVKELIRVLKPNGQIILTFPFGKHFVGPKYRVYNWKDVKKLIYPMKIKSAKFFIRERGEWLPSDRGEAETLDSSTLPVNAMVFLDLRKESQKL